MKKIDSSLIKFFQKMSDGFQSWFSVNNFGLARFFLALSLFSALSEIIQRAHLGFLDGIVILTVFISGLIAGGMWFMISSGESICKNNPVFINPNVARLRGVRYLEIIFLFIALPTLTFQAIEAIEKGGHFFVMVIFHDLYRVTFLFCLYFASCTPKPPSRSKVRKMIEKISERFQAVPNLSTAKN